MKRVLALLYSWVVRVRARLYAQDWLPSHQLDRPVISVGNITMGGTGKTPFVGYLAEIFLELGYQPIILSRGYRGLAEKKGLLVSDGSGSGPLCDPAECGDEPYLLARRIPRAMIAVGRNRVRSAREMLPDLPERGIFLLDDGFQHFQIKRNLDIVLLDGTRPFGGYRLPPAGSLREPLSGLKRADLIVVTRAHLPLDLEKLENGIRENNPLVPINYFYHDATAVYELGSGREIALRELITRRVVALAAIGNPDVFLSDLRHYQCRIVGELLFRDHHPFSQKELDLAQEKARSLQAQLITTEKDAVRLQKLNLGEGGILVFQITPRSEDDQEYRRFILEELEHLPPAH